MTVGLGTDSPASTPSFDVFEEMRAAIYAARARERRPEALLAAEALRLATLGCGPRPANGRRGGYPDARQARRPGGRVARGKPLPSGRGSRGGRRLRRLAGTSARDDRRRADPVPKRETRNSGKRYAAPQAPPGAKCSRRSSSRDAPKKQKPPEWQEELFFSRLRNHAKWAYVFLAVAFVLGFVLLGVGSGSNGLSDIFQSAFSFGSSSGGTSIGSLQKKVGKHPQNATAWRDLATAYEQKQRTAGRRHRAAALHRAEAEGRHGLLASSRRSTRLLSRTYATDYQNAQLEGAHGIADYARSRPPATTVFGKIFADPKASAGSDRGRDPARRRRRRRRPPSRTIRARRRTPRPRSRSSRC